MAFFLGTTINRIDKKGRVSVPAPFRAVLERSQFQGVVVLRSFQAEALDAFSLETMQEMAERLDQLELFSPRRSWLEAALFGNAHQIQFDGDGRISVTDPLRQAAGITEEVAFVGMNRFFRMMSPEGLAAFQAQAREAVASGGLSLPAATGAGRAAAAAGVMP